MEGLKATGGCSLKSSEGLETWTYTSAQQTPSKEGVDCEMIIIRTASDEVVEDPVILAKLCRLPCLGITVSRLQIPSSPSKCKCIPNKDNLLEALQKPYIG